MTNPRTPTTITSISQLIQEWASHVQGANEKQIQALIHLLNKDHLLCFPHAHFPCKHGNPSCWSWRGTYFNMTRQESLGEEGPKHEGGEHDNISDALCDFN